MIKHLPWQNSKIISLPSPSDFVPLCVFIIDSRPSRESPWKMIWFRITEFSANRNWRGVLRQSVASLCKLENPKHGTKFITRSACLSICLAIPANFAGLRWEGGQNYKDNLKGAAEWIPRKFRFPRLGPRRWRVGAFSGHLPPPPPLTLRVSRKLPAQRGTWARSSRGFHGDSREESGRIDESPGKHVLPNAIYFLPRRPTRKETIDSSYTHLAGFPFVSRGNKWIRRCLQKRFRNGKEIIVHGIELWKITKRFFWVWCEEKSIWA